MYYESMTNGMMMFGGWGFSHWLFFILMVAAILYPVGLILQKLGYSPFWSVIALVPVVNLLGLWIVALNMTSASRNR